MGAIIFILNPWISMKEQRWLLKIRSSLIVKCYLK